MNFLYISPFFYPEKISTGRYNNFVVNELIKKGHHVNVICSHPLYPDWIPIRSDSKLAGAKIYRGGLWVRYSPYPIIRRMILELWFSFYVSYSLWILRDTPSRVIMVSPPSLYFLFPIIFFSNKVKLIGIVHDLQGIFAGQKGVIGNLIRSAIIFVEASVFQKCNKLIFLSEEMRSQSISFYRLDKSKTEVCYPFVSFDDSNNDDTEFNEIIDVNYRSLVYSGALGEKQNPGGLVNLLNHVLQIYPDWKGYIFSSGPEFEKLKNTNTNNRLIFKSFVPDALLTQLINHSDVQIVPQASGTSKGSLPSKIPNLVYCGARILCITDKDSELGHLLLAYPPSKVINTWDLGDATEAFGELIQVDKNKAGSSQLLERFSIECLIKKLEDIN